jgi:uncharacterized protein (TIGR02391 family)
MNTGLVIPKDKFKSDLNLRIAEGQVIFESYSIKDELEYFEKLERAFRQWDKYNQLWLEKSFALLDTEYLASYQDAGAWNTTKVAAAQQGWDTNSYLFKVTFFKEEITKKIEFLEDMLHQIEFIEVVPPVPPAPPIHNSDSTLAHLHPTVQQAAGSLFASAHYPQAILAICTALDKTVQAKAGLPATAVGTTLMTTAFSAKAPLIKLADDLNEQMGFMNLYQGSVQAIRNHYAHNLTEIPAARCLEWLGFISALFYKLDEAQPITP